MKTEDVLRQSPDLKRMNSISAKRGFWYVHLLLGWSTEEARVGSNELPKIQFLKDLCRSGVFPKEAYLRTGEELGERLRIFAVAILA